MPTQLNDLCAEIKNKRTHTLEKVIITSLNQDHDSNEAYYCLAIFPSHFQLLIHTATNKKCFFQVDFTTGKVSSTSTESPAVALKKLEIKLIEILLDVEYDEAIIFNTEKNKLSQEAIENISGGMLHGVTSAPIDHGHGSTGPVVDDQLATIGVLKPGEKVSRAGHEAKARFLKGLHAITEGLSHNAPAPPPPPGGIDISHTSPIKAKTLDGGQVRPTSKEALSDARKLYFSKHQIPAERVTSTPVAIIGGGPAGLAGAIQLAKEGIPSVIIEARGSVDRVGMMAMTKENTMFLIDCGKVLLAKDPEALVNKTPLKNIMGTLESKLVAMESDEMDQPSVQTKDIQALLLNYIKNELHGTVTVHTQCKPISVNGNAQAFAYKDGGDAVHGVSFTTIIHADGAHSPSSQLLFSETDPKSTDVGSLVLNKGVGKHDVGKQPNYPHVGAMFMRETNDKPILAPGVQKTVFNPLKGMAEDEMSQRFERILDELQEKHGWTQKRLPIVYLMSDHDSSRVWMAGERPEGVQTQEDLESWFSTLAKIQFPDVTLEQRIGSVKVHGATVRTRDALDTKVAELQSERRHLLSQENTVENQRQIMELEREIIRFQRKIKKVKIGGATFPMTFKSVHRNEAAFGIGYDGYSIKVGDAMQDPIFFFGHGTNDAMADAIQAANLMSVENGCDVKAYRSYANDRIMKVRDFYRQHNDKTVAR
jgi:2-polyprenyl-6-methoxyphenol hydroxylase-like FAD-dependent oxidoreductase